MQDNMFKCNDGEYCNIQTDGKGWACCQNHRGRAKCSKNYPVMCAKRNCAYLTDYCCETKQSCKNLYDGVRQCEERKCHFDYPIHEGLKYPN